MEGVMDIWRGRDGGREGGGRQSGRQGTQTKPGNQLV